MNKPVGTLRNESRAWVEVPADDNGDAMIAAMAEAGVDYIFFTSGSEIGFYQEAVAKAHAQGRKAPKLITVTHEHASLNAALGYAAVSGKPAVTAAHVDCGTQHYGGAVHTAFHCGLPVVITGGGSPTSYPGSFPGARDGGGHIWLQQSFDQNGIVRQYTKWDHRMAIAGQRRADDLARPAGGAHRAVRAGLSHACRARCRCTRSRARSFRPWTSSAWPSPPRPTPKASARSRGGWSRRTIRSCWWRARAAIRRPSLPSCDCAS